MNPFCPVSKAGPYFEGWYFKHQNPSGRTLALIPAFHIDSTGHRTVSLQVISRDKVWWLEYPQTQLDFSRWPLRLRIGRSSFSKKGIALDMEQAGLSLHGTLCYGPFTALRSDIMGPFRLFAGMQCSHGVISMGHSLKGMLTLNGEQIDFSGGIGYIETNRGRSFPGKYLWTQCVWETLGRGSLMLAIATIPLPVGGFTGCICSVFYRGREYRLATYQGARIERWSSTGAAIRQGRYRLEAELLHEKKQPLRAPVEGRMERTIHESLCAKVRYRFWRGKELLFEHTDENASFLNIRQKIASDKSFLLCLLLLSCWNDKTYLGRALYGYFKQKYRWRQSLRLGQSLGGLCKIPGYLPAGVLRQDHRPGALRKGAKCP